MGGRLHSGFEGPYEGSHPGSEKGLDLDHWPKITVVVPILNEATFIARTLSYLQEQDYPAECLEILVVIGPSSDGTEAIVDRIAAEDPRIRWYPNPRRLSSAARNIGAREATGEIVTFVDGHVYIDNDQLLKNTALLMQENQVAVLSRPQLLDTPENSLFQRAVSLARKSPLGHGTDSTIYSLADALVNPASSGATYRREVFADVGFFDERFDAAEDYEFNYRVSLAGYKAFTSARLTVYYYPRGSFGALFRQMERYGRGRMRLFRKHPRTLGLGTLVPPGLLLAVPATVVLGVVLPWAGMLLGGLLGLYFLGTCLQGAVSGLGASQGSRMLKILLIPPILWTVHLGLGYGFLAELVGGRPLEEPSADTVSGGNP